MTFHPRFNVICGVNGSGKTSFIEALYLLSTGHSFRTRETASLVSHHYDTTTLFAKTNSNETVSLQKSIHGNTIVRLNQQPCGSSSELTRFLPCQLFYQDLFQIIEAGPAVRRSLFDWGLFHVKQSFLDVWKDYRRVLKQRNTLLRQKASRAQFVPWNRMLVDLANQIDRMRQDYFNVWLEAFQRILPQLTEVSCALQYFKGWDKKNQQVNLADILEAQFASDCLRQYTQSGAHQADLVITDIVGKKAKQTFSRGQQKIILIALKIAQTTLLQRPCLYLMDDLGAELDEAHLSKLLCYFDHLDGQFFLTALNDPREERWLKKDNVWFFSIHEGVLHHVSRET